MNAHWNKWINSTQRKKQKNMSIICSHTCRVQTVHSYETLLQIYANSIVFYCLPDTSLRRKKSLSAPSKSSEACMPFAHKKISCLIRLRSCLFWRNYWKCKKSFIVECWDSKIQDFFAEKSSLLWISKIGFFNLNTHTLVDKISSGGFPNCRMVAPVVQIRTA